jgi:molybdate transport system regulatory protein
MPSGAEKKPRAAALHPRLRVLRGEEIALGPGKADLLEAIESAGTIAEAARRLGMSYNRAWTLLQTMNACFAEPLVEAARGGSGRGSAALTATGRRVLALYRRMESESLAATAAAFRELRSFIAR